MRFKHWIYYVFYKLLNKKNKYKYLQVYLYPIFKPVYYTLIEYPKCGRTWVRYMINQAEAIKYDIPLRNTMHDIVYIKKNLPRVYYVHGFKPNSPLQTYNYMDSFRKGLTPNGIIFLVRSPVNMLVSYYYQICYRKKTNKTFNDFSTFIRDPHYGIQKYIDYLTFYMHALESTNFILVRYEDLKNNTFDELKRILLFVGLDLNESEINSIIINSTFEKMREIEQAQKYQLFWIKPAYPNIPNSYKTRSMGKNTHLSHYSEADITYVKSACRGTVLQRLYPEIL